MWGCRSDLTQLVCRVAGSPPGRAAWVGAGNVGVAAVLGPGLLATHGLVCRLQVCNLVALERDEITGSRLGRSVLVLGSVGVSFP